VPPSRNLAARAGAWSAQHRKTAVFGWLAFVIVAFVLGNAAGMKTLSDSDTGNGDSRVADEVIDKAGFDDRAGEQVLVQGRDGLRAKDPAFTAAVQDVERRLSATKHVEDVKSPFASGNEGQLSKDGRSALISFEIAGDEDDAEAKIDPILASVAAAQKAHPELRVEQFGSASADKAISKSFSDDFKRAELLSLPITLIILLIAFGALVAAGIPLLLALTAVAATIGLLGPISQLAPVDESISSVILLIGLAVGVDYTMFYLRREREERAAGRSEDAALAAAAATSGRAVLVSGLTVMVAMAGMYLAGNAVFTSFATGTIMVVGVAVIGSVTVLPALLSKLGDRVMKGRVPFIARMRESRGGESRIWSAILDTVLARPWISACLSAGLLLLMAVPALDLHTVNPGIQGLSRDIPAIQTYDRIDKAFPGGNEPAAAVVRADDVTAPEVQAGIAELKREALATGKMSEPVQVEVNPRKDVAIVSIPLQGTGTDQKSDDALAALRNDVIPATIDQVPGTRTEVTGFTAGSRDFTDQLKSSLPYVFAFVLGLSFLLLLVTFRSIVIPLKAIVLNLLSVGAAYGVLVWVFQDGHLTGLLDFRPIDGITSWLPLFLFVILFGLSMDYHVLIISRIREAVDAGMNTEQAVSHGIKATAGVVTSAAVVMIGVFAIFGSLSALEFKQMGVGLAVAVAIDATIVRAVLLPASMKLLGDWNWYLPKALHWLPRISHEEPAPARA
jgi:RND superfamily putative drug exporter